MSARASARRSCGSRSAPNRPRPRMTRSLPGGRRRIRASLMFGFDAATATRPRAPGPRASARAAPSGASRTDARCAGRLRVGERDKKQATPRSPVRPCFRRRALVQDGLPRHQGREPGGWNSRARRGTMAARGVGSGSTGCTRRSPKLPPTLPDGSSTSSSSAAGLTRTAAGARRARQGAPSISVTEDGVATDDGRKLKDNYGYPTNLTYAKAAEILSSKSGMCRPAMGSGISMYLIYQSHDKRTQGPRRTRRTTSARCYKTLSDKGNWSCVVRALIATSRPRAWCMSTRAEGS